MRKLKALIAGLTALCMCAAYMPLTETILLESVFFSAHAEESGTCGENITWTLSNTGVLTFSGTGGLTSDSSVPSKGVKSIVIEQGITSIQNYAFHGFHFDALESVTLPDTLEFIGSYAFENCYGFVSSLTLPESLVSIGDCAFDYCPELKEITVLNPYCVLDALNTSSVSIIHGYSNSTAHTYAGEHMLTFISLDDDSANYEGECGQNLTWKLSSTGTLSISGTGKMYDFQSGKSPWYLERKNIQNIIINSNVTSIGSYAFENCNYTVSVKIPDSITSIGNCSFSYCSSLEILHFQTVLL